MGRSRAIAVLWGLILGLFLVQAAFAQAQGDPYANETRRIASKLQCPVCEGESVADSHAAIAADMRAIISEKLAAGESEPQILQYFVDRYGVAILRDPPARGFYAAVWWMPVIAVGVGIGVVYLVARNRRKPANAQTDELEVTGADLDAYRARLRSLERDKP